MFEIKQLDEPRIHNPFIKAFVDLRLNQMYQQGFSIGLDTKTLFIESANDLDELGVFDDDGLFIEYIEFHPANHCIEVYLESDALLIIPDDLGVNYRLEEVLINAYSN